jgi:hypothetical protein
MDPRRIVQIAVAGVANTSSTQTDGIILALADDGSLWAAGVDSYATENPWTRVTDLPSKPRSEDADVPF